MEASDHRHRGISCDKCEANNFSGQRFKCLRCVDFDLCQTCFENNATTLQHKADHPMQCLLTRRDQSLFFAGGPGIFSSFTCPICGVYGLGRISLAEHLEENHSSDNSGSEESMCPVCILVHRTELRTSDLAAHVRKEHDEQEELVELLKRTQEQTALGGGGAPIPGELAELLRRRPNAGAGHGRPEERRLTSMARLMRSAHSSRLEDAGGLRDFDEMLRLLGDQRENFMLQERERMHDMMRRSEDRERRLRKSSAISIQHQTSVSRISSALNGEVVRVDESSSSSSESGESGEVTKSSKGKTKKSGSDKLPKRPGLLSALCDEKEREDSLASTEQHEVVEQEMRQTFVKQLLLATLCSENDVVDQLNRHTNL